MNEYYDNYVTQSTSSGIINFSNYGTSSTDIRFIHYRPETSTGISTGINGSMTNPYLRERNRVNEIRQNRREIEHSARLTYEEFLKLADSLKANRVNIDANEKIIDKVKVIKSKKNRINLVNL